MKRSVTEQFRKFVFFRWLFSTRHSNHASDFSSEELEIMRGSFLLGTREKLALLGMETMEKFPIEAERSPLPRVSVPITGGGRRFQGWNSVVRENFWRGNGPIGEIIDGRFPILEISTLNIFRAMMIFGWVLRSVDDTRSSLSFELISWRGWCATFVFRFGYWREEIRARVSYATLRDRRRGGMRWTIGGRWREKRSNGRDNPSKPIPTSNRSKPIRKPR